MKDKDGSLDDALSRWSRRKADARRSTGRGGKRGRAAPQAAPAPAPAPLPAAGDAAAETPRQGAAVPPAGAEGGTELPAASHSTSGNDPDRPLDEANARAMAEDLGLPPLEDLTAASDYRGFLKKGVPASLSRAALRKLWASDPVFANLDRLNEYDEDYRALNAAHEVVATAYRVGKGFLDPDPDPDSDVGAEVGMGTDMASAAPSQGTGGEGPDESAGAAEPGAEEDAGGTGDADAPATAAVAAQSTIGCSSPKTDRKG